MFPKNSGGVREHLDARQVDFAEIRFFESEDAMSAPGTDPDKQKRRHFGPVYGMIAIVLIVVAGFVWWLQYETDDPEMPGETPGPADQIVPPDEPAETQ